VYRGHQQRGENFIMGHEFTGDVIEVGNEVKTVKPGDNVVSIFTTAW
jgi:threonine dehydrogenase-like Zn-dependent dehydrogenase